MSATATDDLLIRAAEASDAPRLLEIYAPYVRETAVSFEYDVPTEEEFRRRISDISARYPYIVAELGGEIAGYCYAGEFHARAAYEHSVETSIYIDRRFHRQGVGKTLYAELERRLSAAGVTNLYACVAFAEPEDEYLTQDSVRFHRKCGYALCAHMHGCGVKFGRRYDIVYLEKIIG